MKHFATLEDALYATGAPDETIFLAMVEMCFVGRKVAMKRPPFNEHFPFSNMFVWADSSQGHDYWECIDEKYNLLWIRN